MGDHAEHKQYDDIDTGPQGTRVFQRHDIERYFAQRRMESNESHDTRSSAAFVGVDGAVRDRRFEIPAGRSTVGRSSTNNIVIDADSVSLVHARVLQKDGEWWVLNLLSTNGTYVNHRKVTDSRLRNGDHVRFGEVELIFHSREPIKTKGSRWLRNLRDKLRALVRYPTDN